jgi:AraC-like DNA-binding protein
MLTQAPNDPVALNFMHFDLVDGYGRLLPRDTQLPPEFIEPPDPDFAEATTRRIVELCCGYGSTVCRIPPYDETVTRLSEAMLRTLLMDMDAAVNPTTGPHPPAVASHHLRMVRKFAVRITENPGEIPSVTDMAREAHCSLAHFSRVFKRVAGQSPELFAMHARLHRAERLLRETDLSVGEIGLAAGYRDLFFFSRQFKKFRGVSPLAFRRQAARERVDASGT